MAAAINKTLLDFVEGRVVLGMNFFPKDYSNPELVGIALGMFAKMGLVAVEDETTLQLLINFIDDVRSGYLDNPYHCFYHAIDVAFVVFYILETLGVQRQLGLSKVDTAALLIAALAHDILHPGLNNLYQVNAKTELAKRYSNQSVLENHSCARLLELLDKHLFLEKLNYVDENDSSPLQSSFIDPVTGKTSDLVSYMKELMVETILNTDMIFHFIIMENLINITEEYESSLSPGEVVHQSSRRPSKIRKLSYKPSPLSSSPTAAATEGAVVSDYSSSSSSSLSSTTPLPILPTPPFNSSNAIYTISTSSAVPIDNSNTVAPILTSSPSSHSQTIPEIHAAHYYNPTWSKSLPNTHKRTLLSAILHGADISNPARPFDVCKKWSDMVIQEFYQQGDAEAANKLPITPSMDRNRSNPIQISVQFNDFIARPYFEALADILGGRLDEVFVDVLVENRARWLENSQGMDLMMNDSSSSVDLAGGEASLAATESSGGIVTGDESTNNEDMAEQTTTTDSSTPIRARCSSSSTDSLKYADIEGDDVYSSVPMSYPIRLGSVGAIKLKPPAPIYESASSLETGSHDSVSTYPQLIFQAAASSTASGGSVSGLFLDRKQPLQRHHPHQHAGSTHSSNPSSTTTASPSTTITTPSSSTHHRGRRLSIAAGTIEIPERFVQKSPQSTRLKQRSLSHGRTSGVSISSLSSSDAIVALTAAAAAAAASSGGGGAASSRGSLSTTPPTTVITTTSDGEQRKNSESS